MLLNILISIVLSTGNSAGTYWRWLLHTLNLQFRCVGRVVVKKINSFGHIIIPKFIDVREVGIFRYISETLATL